MPSIFKLTSTGSAAEAVVPDFCSLSWYNLFRSSAASVCMFFQSVSLYVPLLFTYIVIVPPAVPPEVELEVSALAAGEKAAHNAAIFAI